MVSGNTTPMRDLDANLISAQSRLGSNVYVGHNVHIFPKVILGKNVFVDDNVTLGYPNKSQFNRFLEDLHSGKKNLIDDYVDKPTEIGDDSIIRSGTTIWSGTKTGARLGCDHNVLIGGNNLIGHNVKFLYGAKVYSDNRIGDESVISGFVCNGCVIGNNVAMLGFLVHKYDRPVETLPEPSPIIENGATIGMHATIVGKVRVGRNAYVSAGAVVTADVKPNTLVVGVPAKEKKAWLKMRT
jgi:acetyltransferase-like isoleucine patch superfamily enzyme